MGNNPIPQNVALMAGRSLQNDLQRANYFAYRGTPILAPSPEPPSLLLLGTGLLGLEFVAFRKAKSSGLAFP
jgi:PEP-CTERM motif